MDITRKAGPENHINIKTDTVTKHTGLTLFDMVKECNFCVSFVLHKVKCDCAIFTYFIVYSYVSCFLCTTVVVSVVLLVLRAQPIQKHM